MTMEHELMQNMMQNMMHEPPAPRAGALAGATEDAEFSQGDLPPVVWLRGDEPYASQFTMDADEVMERLGIRRSRLTQISGRELRVGRMRVGRYIRPLYRPEDVEGYRQWTRAPATHQKSSSVIDEAVEKLEEQCDAFEDRMAKVGQGWLDAVQRSLVDAQMASQRMLTELHGQGRAEVTQQLDQATSLSRLVLSRSDQTRDAMDSFASRLEAQTQRLETLQTVVQETSQLLSQTNATVKLWMEHSHATFSGIAEVLKLVLSSQRDATQQVDSLRNFMMQEKPALATERTSVYRKAYRENSATD